MKNETIAALSTAPYKAAIGVIRVSGDDAVKLVSSVFSRSLENVASSSVIHGNIVDGIETVDDVLVSVYLAPKSYTGEDVVEISCHGGVYNCSRILRLLIKNGARQAKNGEYTKRAFLNGKLDLLQAEAVIDLIDSETKQEARAAIGGIKGVLSEKINAVRSSLLDISAQLLAFIDYPDDEIADVSPETLGKEIKCSYDRICALEATYETGKLLRTGIKTVITGKPNVGKSMLMNRLLGEDRSIVTATAGTTRDVIEDTAEICGKKLRLFDTAGVRGTDDEIEKIGVQKTLEKINEADLLLCVFDASEKLTEDDASIREAVMDTAAKKLAVINKTDISESKVNQDGFDGTVYISAKTGDGTDALEREINRLFPTEETAGGVMNIRQYECIVTAKKELENALNNIKMTPDALLSDIERAINALGELTGKTVSEEITENIFSRFCVGK